MDIAATYERLVAVIESRRASERQTQAAFDPFTEWRLETT